MPSPNVAAWPGKRSTRRAWLDRLIDELDAAHETCIAMAVPGLAARVAAAIENARDLRARA